MKIFSMKTQIIYLFICLFIGSSLRDTGDTVKFWNYLEFVNVQNLAQELQSVFLNRGRIFFYVTQAIKIYLKSYFLSLLN